MPRFEPKDPNYESRVRESFSRQTLMSTIGALLARVAPGEVDIELPFRHDLSQQHGYMHAGAVTAICDTACGYAALSLMAAGAEVLTIEYKINFVSPAIGERLVARGRVTRPGRTVTVCAGDVFAVTGAQEKLVASMLATMISLPAEGRA
jgi:uncharacterized protein (TIGR00369 family)